MDTESFNRGVVGIKESEKEIVCILMSKMSLRKKQSSFVGPYVQLTALFPS